MAGRLTIFTSPRPFSGEFDRIQRNALHSWTQLTPRPEIVLLGNEFGTAEVSEELGLRRVERIETAASGAPLLNSVLGEMQRLGLSKLLTYINPDVIVMQDLMEAVSAVLSTLGSCVMVGAPRNVAIPFFLEGPPAVWAGELRRLRRESGPATAAGADLFVFPAGTFDPVLPLSIGRLGWDNWLFWRACTGDMPVVDLSDAVTLIHQDHGGTTHRGSDEHARAMFGSEITENRRRIRWWHRVTIRNDIPLTLSRELAIVRRSRGGRIELARKVMWRQFRITVASVLERSSRGRRLIELYRARKRGRG